MSSALRVVASLVSLSGAQRRLHASGDAFTHAHDRQVHPRIDVTTNSSANKGHGCFIDAQQTDLEGYAHQGSAVGPPVPRGCIVVLC